MEFTPWTLLLTNSTADQEHKAQHSDLSSYWTPAAVISFFRKRESMNDPNDSTSTGDGVPFSSAFIDFCAKVRNDDITIMPNHLYMPFKIRCSSEKEDVELANALLENKSITHLALETTTYTKHSAEAMAKYVRTSKHLQRVFWSGNRIFDRRFQREEIVCCFLPAFQESTSLTELDISFPLVDSGPSYPALENMLTHTQSLRSLVLVCPSGPLVEDTAVAAFTSGLKKNTTLRQLTLDHTGCTTTISPILMSLRDHPLLRRLCLRGRGLDLTGLDNLLQSATSKITELNIWGLMGYLSWA